MTINLMKPPYFVDAGPCPGVYLSEEAYMDHLKRQGIKHPLEKVMEVMSNVIRGEVECKTCGELCMIDGDPPKVFAWCDTCKDYAEGFNAAEYVADYFASLADAYKDARKDREGL